MKTISTLLFLSSLTFGCASTQLSGAGAIAAPQRGAVLVDGPSVKAVVVGPAAIHAYSAFSGGTIYAARVVSGTDSDCRVQANTQISERSGLQADSVMSFTVGAGQVACLETTTKKSFELLWHTEKDAPPSTQLLVAQSL